jgi:hypothetical protein
VRRGSRAAQAAARRRAPASRGLRTASAAHAVARLGRQTFAVLRKRGGVLGVQRRDQQLEPRAIERGAGEQAAQDACIAQVEKQPFDTGGTQAVERQILDLEIGFEAGMAVELGAELQRLAGRLQARRARVDHGAAIAKPSHAGAVQQVGVNARDLRRRVGAQPERAAAGLVDQLEGAQLELVAGAGEQRLEMLDQRRHHQFVAVGASAVEHRTAQFLEAPRLRRQHVSDVLRQQPGRRHERTRC